MNRMLITTALACAALLAAAPLSQAAAVPTKPPVVRFCWVTYTLHFCYLGHRGQPSGCQRVAHRHCWEATTR